jgi:hypothetical protein
MINNGKIKMKNIMPILNSGNCGLISIDSLNRQIVKGFFVTLLIFISSVSQASVTHTFDVSGKLTGANGVTVSGLTYNVSFMSGNCIEVFSGCNSNDFFQFHTSAEALNASKELLNQVFVNISGYDLDTNPFLTSGVKANPYNLAWIITPYAINGKGYAGLVLTQVARNSSTEASDWASLCDCGMWDYQKTQNTETYAVWSLAIQPVPEPANVAMIVLGIGLLLSLQRNR